MAESSPDAAGHAMQENLHVKAILLTCVAIAGSIGIALVAAYGVIHLGNDGRPAPHLAAGFRKPPTIEGRVMLQPDPAVDIGAFRAEKRRLLEGYAWIDRDRGLARIPIERAMALIASGRTERIP